MAGGKDSRFTSEGDGALGAEEGHDLAHVVGRPSNMEEDLERVSVAAGDLQSQYTLTKMVGPLSSGEQEGLGASQGAGATSSLPGPIPTHVTGGTTWAVKLPSSL